jgi:hypothetical protein
MTGQTGTDQEAACQVSVRIVPFCFQHLGVILVLSQPIHPHFQFDAG